jgi:hypothetical protein
VTQRVSDEKAIAIARQHPETLPSLFAWRTDDEEDLSKHHFTAQDLASDLLDERNLNRALQRENVIYDGFVTIGEQGGLHPFGSWSSNLHGAWVTVCIRYEPKP